MNGRSVYCFGEEGAGDGSPDAVAVPVAARWAHLCWQPAEREEPEDVVAALAHFESAACSVALPAHPLRA